MAEDKAIQAAEDKEVVGVEEKALLESSRPQDLELTRIAKGLNRYQVEAAVMVAQYKEPREILARFADAVANRELTVGWVEQCSSTAKRGKQQQRIVDHVRALIWQRRQDIPVCNPAERAKTRNLLIQRNLDKDPELVRKVLVDADNAYSEDAQDDRQAGVTINIGQFQGLQGLSGGPAGPVDDGLTVLEATPGVALPEFGAVTDSQVADDVVDIEPIDDSLADSGGDSGSDGDEAENGDSQANMD